MAEKSYDEVDDIFAQIRLRLSRVRETDPATAEELKGLVIQLEDCVESLIIDSLKLKSLESKPKKATEPQKKLKKPSRK